MDRIERAIEMAGRAHIAQKRKSSGIPYVVHPIEVMKRVADYGLLDEDILIAALLHDVHEDAPEFSEQVKQTFGPYVYAIMIECSRPERDDATKEQKWDFLCSFYEKSPISTVIKIADRYCNVHDYLRTKGKELYASTYALQAYPIYDAFIKDVKGDPDFIDSRDAALRVMCDIATLQSIADREYPQYSELSPKEIRELVIQILNKINGDEMVSTGC